MRKEVWTKPALREFGSVEDLTASGKRLGLQDALFTISIGPVTITVPGAPKGGGGGGGTGS